jgi:hypothetical protein
VLRSLHQATGLALWTATFTLAYLARRASGERPAASGQEERLAANRSPLAAGSRP